MASVVADHVVHATASKVYTGTCFIRLRRDPKAKDEWLQRGSGDWAYIDANQPVRLEVTKVGNKLHFKIPDTDIHLGVRHSDGAVGFREGTGAINDNFRWAEDNDSHLVFDDSGKNCPLTATVRTCGAGMAPTINRW
jgi:hypothetical protein